MCDVIASDSDGARVMCGCNPCVGDAAFVGATLFLTAFGPARCDFPGGDAEALYDSIQRILELPSDTRLFMCHDYKGPDRDEYAWETTIAEQRQNNVHIHDGTSKEAFVAFRKKRDAQLGVPKLILPSIQVNIRSGDMPGNWAVPTATRIVITGIYCLGIPT